MAQRIVAFKSAFWKFLRPHTIRGTILGSTAVTALALLENTQLIDWALLPRAALGVLALLCGNGYIVGINQVGGCGSSGGIRGGQVNRVGSGIQQGRGWGDAGGAGLGEQCGRMCRSVAPPSRSC